MRKIFIFTLYLLATICSHSQSFPILTEKNCFRAEDKLEKVELDFSSLNLSQSNLSIVLSDYVCKPAKIFQTITGSSDTHYSLMSIERKQRKYFCVSKEGMELAGEEQPLSKCTYNMPEIWLPYHFCANDSVTGVFYGNGVYCRKLAFRKFGTYKTKVIGYDDFVFFNGDTIKNVACIQTVRKHLVKYLPPDSQLSYSNNADSIIACVDTASHVITEKQYRWFITGYRYPIVESFTLYNVNGEKLSEWATVCSLESQHSLSDEENESVRNQLTKEDKDERNTAKVKLDYDFFQDNSSSSIKIQYHLPEADVLSFILADTKGVAYRKITRNALAGTNTETISYIGLPHGQYIVYISYKGMVFTEKFTKK